MRYLQRDSYLPCCITDGMVCADDEREDRLVYRAASLDCGDDPTRVLGCEPSTCWSRTDGQTEQE